MIKQWHRIDSEIMSKKYIATMGFFLGICPTFLSLICFEQKSFQWTRFFFFRLLFAILNCGCRKNVQHNFLAMKGFMEANFIILHHQGIIGEFFWRILYNFIGISIQLEQIRRWPHCHDLHSSLLPSYSWR